MKKILVSAIVTLAMSGSSLFAYDLKTNMQLLNADLGAVRNAFITSDMNGVKSSIQRFAKHSQELLGNKDKFKDSPIG